MLRNQFYKDVFKALLAICSILLLCRVTLGGTAILVVFLGFGFIFSRKPGYLAACYVMFPVFTIFNRAIVGISSIFLLTARLGNLALIFAMMLSGMAFSGPRAREKLPLGWLFAYACVACFSSLDGWMPLISYLKIAQFILFLMGLYFVGHLLQQSDHGLYQLRCVFMALTIIFIVGSLVSRAVPSVGFSMTISKLSVYGIEKTASELAESEGMVLFNGMTCHSQMLAPTVSLLMAWVLGDMLLVERRLSMLHLFCLSLAPILLYMSRSRGGLLEATAVLLVTLFIMVPRARLTRAVKSRLFQLVFWGVVFLVGILVIAQVRNQTLSKWLRKTEDVGGDNRSLKEAFTGSRQGLIQYNLHDFKLNPLLGKGFQVMAGMEQAYRSGRITWYSASIEKGVTPYVILGETGIVGAVVFIFFLISFYATCLKRRYLSLLTTFTCVLVANLADSTLFSPGGSGGFDWVVACVGGFSTDLISIRMAHRGMLPGKVGPVPLPSFVQGAPLQKMRPQQPIYYR